MCVICLLRKVMLLGKVNQNVSNIKIRADSQRQKCHVCAKVNMGWRGFLLWTFFLMLSGSLMMLKTQTRC